MSGSERPRKGKEPGEGRRDEKETHVFVPENDLVAALSEDLACLSVDVAIRRAEELGLWECKGRRVVCVCVCV